MAGQLERGSLRWPLEFTHEIYGGVPVLIAIGRVSHASAEAFGAALQQALDSAAPAGLVLDLERVDYISSAGLLAVEAAAGRFAATGAGLVVVAPPEPVRIALDLAGLLARLTIEPSRSAAVARVGRG